MPSQSPSRIEPPAHLQGRDGGVETPSTRQNRLSKNKLLHGICIPVLFSSMLPVQGQLTRKVTLPGSRISVSSSPSTALLPMSDPTNEGGWVIYEPLSDDFDGTHLDTSKWKTNISGWPGRPPALFVDHNVEVSRGTLQITMRKEPVSIENAKGGFHDYTTGAVQSITTVLYGYFEVRAKAMKSAGSSAFLFADKDDKNWNEIDVFEMGGALPAFTRRVYMSVHNFKENGLELDLHDTKFTKMRSNVADEFHVYGLDWSPDSIDFYVDGRLRRHLENTSWHIPANMIFDAETQVDWFGMPKDSDLPSVFTIDYVRAWKKARQDAGH
jgi:beta-glucanase (GH16 family)